MTPSCAEIAPEIATNATAVVASRITVCKAFIFDVERFKSSGKLNCKAYRQAFANAMSANTPSNCECRRRYISQATRRELRPAHQSYISLR